MDKFLIGLIDKEFRIGKLTLTFLDIVLALGITAAGVVIRFVLRSVVTDDWIIFWDPWLKILKEGGFAALATDFYDYAPPFMYILYFISLLPVNPMTAYKVICCIFDFIAAFAAAKIVFSGTRSTTKALGTYAVMVILPTMIANSALWAQCDIIYAAFILICIYYLFENKPGISMLFYGIAFAFKLQTLFIFPFLVILWAKKKIKLQHFLWIPAMYTLGILPAFLAGRPLGELINIYAAQGAQDVWSLSIKWPNIYQIIGTQHFLYEYADAGVWLIIGILMCVLFYMAQRTYSVSKVFIIQMALFFAVLTPYFLPHMHERYGFLADILAILYGIFNVRRFFVPLLHIIVSYAAYSNYLSHSVPVPLGIYAFVELGLLVVIGLDVYHYINDPKNRKITLQTSKTV